MLSPPPGFKSHGGHILACCDEAQGVDSPTLVESRLLLSHKFLVDLACELLDILLML